MYIQTSSLSITTPYPSFLSSFYRPTLYPCPSGFIVLSVFFFSMLSISPSSSLLLHPFPPLTGTLSFFSGYLDHLFSCPTLLLLSLVQASEEETQMKCLFINASQGLG